jgi:hypothetical protein
MIFHLCAVRQKRVLISARLAAAHMYPANIHASQHQKQIFGTCANRLSAVCIMCYWTTFSINKHTPLKCGLCYSTLDWITIASQNLCRLGTKPKFPLNDLSAYSLAEPLPSFEVQQRFRCLFNLTRRIGKCFSVH